MCPVSDRRYKYRHLFWIQSGNSPHSCIPSIYAVDSNGWFAGLRRGKRLTELCTADRKLRAVSRATIFPGASDRGGRRAVADKAQAEQGDEFREPWQGNRPPSLQYEVSVRTDHQAAVRDVGITEPEKRQVSLEQDGDADGGRGCCDQGRQFAWRRSSPGNRASYSSAVSGKQHLGRHAGGRLGPYGQARATITARGRYTIAGQQAGRKLTITVGNPARRVYAGGG